jgi:hypothetical protein
MSDATSYQHGKSMPTLPRNNGRNVSVPSRTQTEKRFGCARCYDLSGFLTFSFFVWPHHTKGTYLLCFVFLEYLRILLEEV